MHRQRGSILKGFIIYLVVSFALFVAVVEISKKIQSPLEGTTRSFFEAIQKGYLTQAYTMLSKKAHYEMTPYDFNQFIRYHKLNQYQSSSWNKIDEKEGVATVTGHIVLRGGHYVRVEVGLVSETTDKAVVRNQTIDFKNVPFADKLKVWKIDSINLQ